MIAKKTLAFTTAHILDCIEISKDQQQRKFGDEGMKGNESITSSIGSGGPAAKDSHLKETMCCYAVTVTKSDTCVAFCHTVMGHKLLKFSIQFISDHLYIFEEALLLLLPPNIACFNHLTNISTAPAVSYRDLNTVFSPCLPAALASSHFDPPASHQYRVPIHPIMKYERY
jgi:hypothetical protein